jgi:hypothetical protein
MLEYDTARRAPLGFELDTYGIDLREYDLMRIGCKYSESPVAKQKLCISELPLRIRAPEYKTYFFLQSFFSKSQLTFGGACQNRDQISQPLRHP